MGAWVPYFRAAMVTAGAISMAMAKLKLPMKA